MPAATDLFLIKRISEFQKRSDLLQVPKKTRGVYVLYQRWRKQSGGKLVLVDPDEKDSKSDVYRVVYVGMAGGPKSGMRGRLHKHARTKAKEKHWSHFTILEVHDNIPESVVRELEGIIRHVYRRDRTAHRLAGQWSFLRLKRLSLDLKEWT